MSKHTPGPWKAVYVGSSDWDLEGPITEADWTLAAAAPELLAALKLAKSIIAHPTDAHSKLIAAAIAKAEGRS